MKTRNLLWAGLIGLIVVLFGCKKELPELSEESVSQVNLTVQEFISFDWTNEERRFFELNSGLSDLKNQDIQNRGVEGSVIYHPEVIHLYNTIARQNEEDLFIENIVENVGLPVWRYAIVNEDEESQEKLVILPLIDAQQGKTNAIITSWKTSGNYVINAHTRESLLDIQSDDIERKIAFLEALAYYDSFLFDDKQGESVEALCRYNDSLNPSNDPSNLPPDSPDCSWNVLVICSDLNTQTTWFGGVSNMPPHLDHDGDGIINGEDQDFLSLGITQDQFEGWLREWWLQNEYEHLGDYDQYFQNNGGGSWYNDYEEIMEFWEGIWQDMWLDWQDQIYDAWY
ncbi:MAG: hypothetical protein KI786_15750, partial [Mameliella sp.]|nr:hypothetical protein [Phaeodactylibacter sp.]